VYTRDGVSGWRAWDGGGIGSGTWWEHPIYALNNKNRDMGGVTGY